MLEEIELDKRYIADILMVFPQSNPFKVALDKDQIIIEIYENLGQKNEFVALWLSLMSQKPSSFETINVETKDIQNVEEIFLKVCSSTKSQQKLIVYSKETLSLYDFIDSNQIDYKGKKIIVYDRDDAIIELKETTESTILNIKDSIVGTEGSKMRDIKNLKNGKKN